LIRGADKEITKVGLSIIQITIDLNDYHDKNIIIKKT
jgi:hypothetical protein